MPPVFSKGAHRAPFVSGDMFPPPTPSSRDRRRLAYRPAKRPPAATHNVPSDGQTRRRATLSREPRMGDEHAGDPVGVVERAHRVQRLGRR